MIGLIDPFGDPPEDSAGAYQERLRERCEAYKGQVEAGAHEIGRLRARIEQLEALLEDACQVFDHYDLPEHAFHYRRILANSSLTKTETKP